MFPNLYNIINKRSIKCRSPLLQLWFADYEGIVNNIYSNINTKLIILRDNNISKAVSKKNIDIHDEYLKIKFIN